MDILDAIPNQLHTSFPDGFHSLSRPVVALIHPAILIPWKGFPNKNP